MSGNRAARGASVPPRWRAGHGMPRARGGDRDSRRPRGSSVPAAGRARSNALDQSFEIEDASALLFCISASKPLIHSLRDLAADPTLPGFGSWAHILTDYASKIRVMEDFVKVILETKANPDLQNSASFADIIISARLTPDYLINDIPKTISTDVAYFKFVIDQVKHLFISLGLEMTSPFEYSEETKVYCTSCPNSEIKIRKGEFFKFTGSLRTSLEPSSSHTDLFCKQCKGIRMHYSSTRITSTPKVFHCLTPTNSDFPDNLDVPVRPLYAVFSEVNHNFFACLKCESHWIKVSKSELSWIEDVRAAGNPHLLFYGDSIIDDRGLQVAGKERESRLSSQFRDIAKIVMQKTINPETQRPYTISMIESLMHEIQFSVDPDNSSKKQALKVIQRLQKHFPIKRAPVRLRVIVTVGNYSSLVEELCYRNATIISDDKSGDQQSIVCEVEPSFFCDFDAHVRNLQESLKILAVSVCIEGDANVD